jgi:hypothetical protein
MNKTKLFKVFVYLSIVTLFNSNNFQLNAAQSQMAGIVTTTRGDVKVLSPKTKKWRPAKTGDFLYEGDTVETKKKSNGAISLTNGAVMKVNQNTKFSFQIAAQIEKMGAQIKLVSGQIWTKVRPKTKFEIHTPVAVVAVRGTEFDTNLTGGNLELSVYSGTVNVKNKYGEVNVPEGKKSSCGSSGAPGTPTDLKKEENPTWQDAIVSKGSLKLEVKAVKTIIDTPFEMAVSVLDTKGNLDKTAKCDINIKVDSSGMAFSQDNKNWSGELNILPAEGVAKIFAKISAQGSYSIAASAESYSADSIMIKASDVQGKTLKLKVKTADGNTEEVLLKFKKK